MNTDLQRLEKTPLGWSSRMGTLAQELHVQGRGLHTGRKVNLRILPADSVGGQKCIVFRRRQGQKILAEACVSPENWKDHPFCSSLDLGNGLYVRTVEHLLAALLMCEIDAATVELDAEETPILDSSAAKWIAQIRACGRVELPWPKRFMKIVKNFEIKIAKAKYRIAPADGYFLHSIIHEHDFPRMTWQARLTPEVFASELAFSRSFGHLRRILPAILAGFFMKEPLLRGAWSTSAAIIFNKKVLGGMIAPDELVRHRTLDFIGDFAYLGAPVLGAFHIHRMSHNWNHQCLNALLATKDAWVWAQAPEDAY